ncbi:MAG: hypothetical protein ABIQ27_12960, partial [Flavobacterium sp.]|uniref:hypothetical protein n=1 Tax=Flavobacterium sp. TaxID=239 RepID=UPI0032645FB7
LTSVANGRCALPDDYYSNFSYISFINYPVTTTNKLCTNEYKVTMDTDGKNKIFLSNFNTADIKFVYSIPLEFIEAENETGKPKVDIDKIDVDCICDIAASYYCLTKAARFGDSKSSTQSADAVNYLDKVNLFIKLSNEFLTKASAWLNIDINELKKGQAVSKPGADMQEFDSNFRLGGDFLTH